jgi:acetolactate synthase-1/2/3 large subunit
MIGGNASRVMLHKESHQSAANIKLLEGATKFNQEVYQADDMSAAAVNAYRAAKAPKSGATFISIPLDVSHEETKVSVVQVPDVEYATLALPSTLEQATSLLNHAKAPVLFLGNEASKAENSAAINELLAAHPMPVVMTFQACGSLTEESADCFFGRLGLFKNQPGDKILDQADVIVAVGYHPLEYDPEEWNTTGQDKQIIHINYTMADIHQKFQPRLEVLGDISANLRNMLPLLGSLPPMENYAALKEEYEKFVHSPKSKIDSKGKIHPLRFIQKLQEHTTKDTIIACDIGSNGTWMSRYFRSYHPHQMLISNGQQTLEVAVPWAMAAKLTHPDKTVIASAAHQYSH